MNDLGNCDRCKQPLIEIDHYGERFVGCIECNCWSWRGSQRLFMELSEDDLDALRRVRNGRRE
jgi:hypothetical protein